MQSPTPLAGDEPNSYTFLVAAFLLLPTRLPLSISLVEVVIQEAVIKIIDIVEMFSPPLSALIPNPYHLLLTFNEKLVTSQLYNTILDTISKKSHI